MDVVNAHRHPVSATPGKKQRIDNTKRSGKNNATQQAGKLVMPNAMTLAAACKLLAERCRACEDRHEPPVGAHPLPQAMRIGGEDMPDAFRGIPIAPEHLKHDVVAAKNPRTGKVPFFQLYAALFGFESAVYSFGRLSGFLQALCCRPVDHIRGRRMYSGFGRGWPYRTAARPYHLQVLRRKPVRRETDMDARGRRLSRTHPRLQ